VSEDDLRVDWRLNDLSPDEDDQESRAGGRAGLVGPHARVLAAVRRPHLGDQKAAVLQNLDPA